MSEKLHELCCALVEDFLGEFHARLFSQVVYYGRLSAPQIAQKSHLPLKQIRTGLATLIQLRLIYHHTTPEGQSTYQANMPAAYNLRRIGKLVKLADRHHGRLAGLVVSEAFLLGFCTIAELEHRTFHTPVKTHTNLANGYHHIDGFEHLRAEDIRATITSLLDAGFLRYVRPAHFQSAHDARRDAELFLKSTNQLPVAKGKKGQDEIDAKIDAEVQRRLGSWTMEYGYTPDVSFSRKRSLQELDHQSGAKRQKVNGESFTKVNGHSSYATENDALNSAVVVRVDFKNLTSYTRNVYLAARAKTLLNATYSEVLRAALSQVPSTSKRENPIDVQYLQDEVNQSGQDSPSHGHSRDSDAKTNGAGWHQEKSGIETKRMSYNEVDRALAVLADSEFRFLRGAYGKDWTIDNEAMKQYIQQHEVSRLMSDGLEAPALRVIRMLMSKGKLDEKTLQEVGLLSAKDLRQTLGKLKRRGYVDLQEVPREAQRQPNRTIYLWFHDSERVRKVLLNSLYKAMMRLMQRLKLERAKMAPTLEKTERTDVKGREEDFLPIVESKLLKRWRRLEQWIIGEIERLDESVTLLRDL